MIQPDLSREVRLTIPARQDYALVASMTLCGLGMAAGLDMDLLGDLRTVTCESMDCLLHQAGRPEWIEVRACVKDGRPKLQSIQLDYCALVGDWRADRKTINDKPYNYKNTLTMRSENK